VVERQAKQGEEGADVDACVDVLRNCGTWTQAWTISHVNMSSGNSKKKRARHGQ
jgi:hypothetical protein